MAADRPAAAGPGAAGPGAAALHGADFDAARFVRAARAAGRARVPRSERFVDAYVLVVAVLVVGAWIYGGTSGLGAQLGAALAAGGPGGALEREPAAWLGPGVPLLGSTALLALAWAGLVRTLLVLGPVGIAPDRAFWLWRLPLGEDREPARAVRRAALTTGAASAGVGGGAAVAAWWAGVLPAGEGSAVHAAALAGCATALGVTAVGAAALLQAGTAGTGSSSRRGRRVRAALAVLLAAPVAWTPAVATAPPATALALAGLAAVAAAGAVVAGARAARSLTGDELRRAGARGRHLVNAVRLMSTADLRHCLTGTDQGAVRRPSAPIPRWVRGPRRVVLFAALTAEARTAWHGRALVDLAVVALLLVAFPGAVVPLAWLALLVVAARGLGRGVAYVVAARAGSAAERQLPLAGAAAARVRLVVPCAANALVVGAAALLAGLAAQAPPGPCLAAGLVAGTGIGAAAVHRVLGPEPDLTQPPIDSPLGPIPHAQVAAYGRGLLLVPLFAAGPAVVVALPAWWPGVLGLLAPAALVAAALAVGADERA